MTFSAQVNHRFLKKNSFFQDLESPRKPNWVLKVLEFDQF